MLVTLSLAFALGFGLEFFFWFGKEKRNDFLPAQQKSYSRIAVIVGTRPS